jgi:hypothetical protein
MAMLRLTAQNSFSLINTQTTEPFSSVTAGVETMAEVHDSILPANGIAVNATCQGVKDAYPVLGATCEKAYAKINHALAGLTCEQLQSTFKARVNTMTVFRQAYLCNGIRGASKAQQNAFIRGQAGHLQALQNLENHMLGLPVPCNPYDTVANITTTLNGLSVNKHQCK